MSSAAFSRDEERWAAVLRRERDADGVFYYSVRSTGVYCRPSCSARPARRENVAFHESPQAAEKAGFRPCKRCHPERSARPSAKRRIRFAVGRWSLGRVLVAASDKGVCAILPGEDADALRRDLQERFPQAQLVEADEQVKRWTADVIRFLEAPKPDLALPLDLGGTEFQRRVWEALREIPPGSTVSYKELAERVGSPDAVRAVAQACAANDLAIAIPCHRVVRSNGSISGYRWGVERKRALLQREAARAV
jgi:AraC family transcriptional regulator, regulatory protein of adaptative response / methylated-DNA-[protein]-cysteine methyltransferase